MKGIDPRHNLRANSAENTDDAWHINSNVARTSWSNEAFYRGLAFTPDEYLTVERRLMALLKENDLCKLKGTGQARKIRLSVVYVKFWDTKPCMVKKQTSYGVTIPR